MSKPNPKFISAEGQEVELQGGYILAADRAVAEGETRTLIAYNDGGSRDTIPYLIGLLMVQFGRQAKIDLPILQLLLKSIAENLPNMDDVLLETMFKDAMKNMENPNN